MILRLVGRAKMSEITPRTDSPDWTRISAIAFLLIAVPMLVWSLLAWLVLPTWEIRGQFGDMFGVLNAFFNAIALLGIIYAISLQRRELRVQNRLLNAQLLKDRFEMYWRTSYEPVTDADTQDFLISPTDYMNDKLYKESYEGNIGAIRRYIFMSRRYEYLAFTFTMRELGVPDPLGPDWVEVWASELIDSPEFLHVQGEYRRYYPKFAAFIDSLRDEKETRGLTQ
jgi:hypothetical protein